MNIVGIVAEYNPFHKGHAYQIRKIREIFGDDTAVVCVMSGDFVQRGEAAVFSKYARAEAAVRCGADLVIELPLHCSIGSAERFAEGAIGVLGRLGVVEYLVFGSESGNTAALIQTAEMLLTPDFDQKLREHLRSGCSFPTARSNALRELMGCADMTCTPNDNLGVEYIKAIRRGGYAMQPYPIVRVGAMHDAVYDGELKSGSELRSLMRAGAPYMDHVPEDALNIYEREAAKGRGPVSADDMETAILSRLRMLKPHELADLPDASEGLEGKLYRACRTETSLSDIYDAVKSKRYTHARIRRMTLCGALGVVKADHSLDNLYARVLALSSCGARVLRQSEKQRNIEVISKPAAARNMRSEALKLFEKAADAHDLYVLAYSHRQERVGEMDWKTGPVFVDRD